ncbi:hypothetical protein N7523_005546 [Penicillium sp. IBT 18751x]|nr:hypothetical protein N7523_005868 [Penicillium sp. IBT 18751x]KAJ6117795.1 hypothetical protein N7523_005546 [Penicillium sp. IBT 18751x]
MEELPAGEKTGVETGTEETGTEELGTAKKLGMGIEEPSAVGDEVGIETGIKVVADDEENEHNIDDFMLNKENEQQQDVHESCAHGIHSNPARCRHQEGFNRKNPLSRAVPGSLTQLKGP